MTPEQEKVLHKTHALVAGMDERFEAIDIRCVECHEELKNTRLILNGRPGDGDQPGIRSRMALVEQSCGDIKNAQRTRDKWFRVQLGAIIAAVIAVASKWFVKG